MFPDQASQVRSKRIDRIECFQKNQRAPRTKPLGKAVCLLEYRRRR